MKINVGNTPIIKIRYLYNGKENYIYSKLEFYNISGSIKDRVVYYILTKAYKKGDLKKGMEIVEATSGNTGIALASMAHFFGNAVHIFMPDWVSKERINLLKMYGAKVTLVSKEEGGFKKAIESAKKYAKENNAFFTNQFANYDNVLAHYETTGKEILNKVGDDIGGFVSGIGTGGTLIGVGKRLKEYDSSIKLFALEPDKMPILTKKKAISTHKIEGIGDDFIPKLVDRKLIDNIILVDDDDAINMARKIARDLGIGVGISSGANMIAGIIANENIEKKIVTVFADDNKKYISTDLKKGINKNKNFVSNNVEFLGFEFVK